MPPWRAERLRSNVMTLGEYRSGRAVGKYFGPGAVCPGTAVGSRKDGEITVRYLSALLGAGQAEPHWKKLPAQVVLRTQRGWLVKYFG